MQALPEAQDGALVPLALGNQWLYEVDGPGDVEMSLERIVGLIRRDGQTWYLLRGGQNPGVRDTDEDWEMWVTNTSGGHADATYEVDPATGLGRWVEASVYFAYPAEVGMLVRPNETVRVRVLAIGEAVTVPAGAYECIVYEETIGDLPAAEYSVRYWVHPGVGIIRSHLIDGTSETVSALRSYELVERTD